MPAVIETPAGDAIAIRHKVIVSLTFDHRIIDGALAGAFLKKISETIQNFDISRKF
jgi:2-oxoglutarate dehydrogenase E2 component (dihydrolipoamide succinyltransferase)